MFSKQPLLALTKREMRDLKIIRQMSKQRQNKLFFFLTKLMQTKRLSCLQVNLIQTEKERQRQFIVSYFIKSVVVIF